MSPIETATPFLVQGSRDGKSWEDFTHHGRLCRAKDVARMLVKKTAMGVQRVRIVFQARVIWEFPDRKMPQIIDGVEV